MNTILSLGNRILVFVNKLNKLKDVWLESRIKAYADDVRSRYPHKLSIYEKIVSPIISKRITGTVANLISVIRLLMAIIVFLVLLIAPYTDFMVTLVISALIIFIMAAFLDLLDGPAARALNEISELGKSLDPLADKALLAAPLLAIGYHYLPSYTFIGIISLECFLIVIAMIKNILKHMPFTMVTQANMAGKIKNIVELVAGGFLFLCPLSTIFTGVSNILFLISVPLALGSIYGYLSSVRRIKKPHLS